MAFQPFPVNRFAGLDLVSDPSDEAGPERALSCLNVALDRNGRIRTRDGYTQAYTTGAAGMAVALHPVSTGTILAAFANATVRVIDLGAGTSAANVALASASSSFASAGTSSVYFTDGTTTQIRKFTGGVFSSPASLATYKGNYLAVQPLEDRLVIADATKTSRLYFSNAATPETITYGAGPPETGDFIELTPGDGEPITGMTVFGTELFVFKRTKFFVFYGNSTNSATGTSVFNYRMVDHGIGCDQSFTSSKLTATHETGVYFVGYDGVYRTVGGPPQKVSDAIGPVFKGTNLPVPAPFSAIVTDPVATWFHLGVATDRLYLLGLAPGNIPVQFVMDLRSGEWTVFVWPAVTILDGAMVADSADTAGYRGAAIFGGENLSTTFGMVAKSNRTMTDDAGTAIPWSWQSGFYDMGQPGAVKTTRWTRLWGSGAPTVSVFTDMGSTDSRAAAVTLGVDPAVAEGYHQQSYQGQLFSHKLSGTGPATVHRLQHDVAGVRP